MRRLEVSCAVRHIYIYMSLGAKGLTVNKTEIKQLTVIVSVSCSHKRHSVSVLVLKNAASIETLQLSVGIYYRS